MKHLTLFLSLFFVQICFAQNNNYGFYIVNDPDGWVNVRDNGNIIDQLNNNKLVFVFVDELDGDDTWISVEYEKNNTDRNGFIHKSRLKRVIDLEKIPIEQESEDLYVFGDDSFKIKIETEPFDLTGRKLEYSKDYPALEKIDGKYIWGADGSIPQTQYKNIEITQNGKQYELPRNAFADLFEPSLDSVYIFYDKQTNTLYITTMNGDGAGGYVVAWSIQNGVYKERLVTHGF